MQLHLPAELAARLEEAQAGWRVARGTERLFARDSTLWTGHGEDRWLGWLDAPESGLASLATWRELDEEAAATGVESLVLLGMGGSSLGAEVIAKVLDRPARPRSLWILDTTSPDRIQEVESSLSLENSLVVVASKSGTTLEPKLLLSHLIQAAQRRLGPGWASRFLAITDPGSALEGEALGHGFRRILAGEPTIGGRFSVLSPFGLAMAALLGFELEPLLRAALDAAVAARDPRVDRNRAVTLGLLLAVAAETGRDKLTLEFPSRWRPLVSWLEQLIAESLGKLGRLVLPLEGVPLLGPDRYGSDRLFLCAREATEAASDRVGALVRAGHPVVELVFDHPSELFAEFYRWEVATAVAGAWLGVHPFDQPDVEAAKVETRRLTTLVEQTGSMPRESEDWSAPPWYGTSDPDLRGRVAQGGSLAELLRAHLGRVKQGDYLALLAFLPPSEPLTNQLERLRDLLAARLPVPVTLGFGPRYLHSTGQAHKGGPDRGVFLLLTSEPERDLPVPGRALTFGQVLEAQARGDFAVLAGRGRRILHLHASGSSHRESLSALEAAILATGS